MNTRKRANDGNPANVNSDSERKSFRIILKLILTEVSKSNGLQIRKSVNYVA